MANVRIPESAEPLLAFCRTSGSNGPHLWETYADMIEFLASYAYGCGEVTGGKPLFLKGGNPIELGTFRSRGLYSLVLTLAIADQRDWLIARQFDQIAETIERFAAAGANLICPHGLNITSGDLANRMLNDLRHYDTNTVSVTI